MKYFILLLGVVGLAHCQNGIPTFSWLQDQFSPDGVPLLSVDFHDGKPSDVALLTQYNPIPRGPTESEEDIDKCIFHGFLRDESKVYVTLTGGCPFENSFEIQFRSTRAIEYMFKVVDSKVNPIIPKYRLDKNFVPDVALHPPVESKKPSLPNVYQPNGVIFNIKFFTDQSLRGVFGGDSQNVLRRVVAQSQNIYYWPTLPTIVTLRVAEPIVDLDAFLSADQGALDYLGNYATDSSINSYFVLTNRYDPSPAAGLAYVNIVCTSALRYRTGVSEYYNNDLESAEYMAHELGHNLGMNHDFLNSPSDIRYDSQGNICTGIRGVMDYSARDKWTTCSYEDFNNSDHSCLQQGK